MANVTRAKVTLRDIHVTGNRRVDTAALLSKFHREVEDACVLHEYKLHETHMTKGEKKRRKKREMRIKHLKAKLRENFPQRR